MQAILLKQTGSPDVLKAVKINRPVPRDNEALIRVHSISMNYADVLIRKGIYPYMPDLPAMLGAECSGYVEQLGANIDGLRAGQPVLVFGKPCYAGYITASKRFIYPLPDNVDMTKAAALPVAYLTAYHLLHSVCRAKVGETALMYAAAGGVGTAMLQLSKLIGVNFIGLCGSAEKVAWLKKNGCWKSINYNEENIVKRVMELTHGQGVDMIFDSVAGKGFQDNFNMLNALGKVVWFGVTAGVPKLNLLKTIARNPAQSAGVHVFHLFSIIKNTALLRKSLQMLIQMLGEGKIDPVIHNEYKLHEVSKAQAALENRTTIGKVILKP